MPLSPWQAKRQAAWLAAQAVWADTPQAGVFPGGAFVSEDPEGNWLPSEHLPDGPVSIALQTDKGFQPWVRVADDTVERDRHSPGRIDVLRLSLSATAGGGFGSADNPGRPDNISANGYDTHGVNQVTGRLRASSNPQGQSQGRTVDELHAALLAWLGGNDLLVNGLHAISGMFTRSPRPKSVYGVSTLARALELEVYDATEANYYHAPWQFTPGTPSAGSVTFTWKLPPSRYDTYQVVMRRGTNPSDPAPTTPGGGTNVPVTGGLLGTSATDSGHSAAQTFNYALFMVYSEVLTGDRWSIPLTASITF